MNIPNFDISRIAMPDGSLSPEAKLLFTQLFQELQGNASQEGLIPPGQPTETITSLNTPNLNGAFLYDTDTHQMKVNLNGTFHVVTTA